MRDRDGRDAAAGNALPDDPVLNLKRFALVLTGDDARAERLLAQLAGQMDLPRAGDVAAGALQYMQFRRLYELWGEMERGKSEPARLFEPGNTGEAIRKGLDPQIAAVMGLLPAMHRVLLLLIYGENYSYAATARLLGISVEQMMYALVRARLPFTELRRPDGRAGASASAGGTRKRGGAMHDAA